VLAAIALGDTAAAHGTQRDSGALELGADALELDVHASRDGAVMVHHDPVPPPHTTEPSYAGIRIAELSLKELKTFWVEPGIGIPTLAAVLRAVANRARVYVEIKARGIEHRVVETIRAAGAAERCAVHSFDHRAAKRVRELAPELRGGVLTDSYLIDPVAAMRAADAADYWIWWEQADNALVQAIHAAGGRVIAWTVNDPTAARALADLGVDGICTDDVPAIRAAMRGVPA
jgi:glycerophosphoryl diester phosphodiesterase